MVEKFDYLESRDDADELLQEFGQIGAIRRTVSVPGPDEFTPGTEIDMDTPITVAVLPIELQDVGRDLAGTLIKSSDKQLLISAKGLEIEPATTDLVLVDGGFVGAEYQGGTPYMLVRSTPLAPAGVVVMHDAIGTR